MINLFERHKIQAQFDDIPNRLDNELRRLNKETQLSEYPLATIIAVVIRNVSEQWGSDDDPEYRRLRKI